MNLAALKAEIELEAYDGLSDQAIADLVNAKTVTRNRLVETWEVKKHAIENGYWAAIVIACDVSDVVPVQVRGLAISARDWIDDSAGKIKSLDMSLASTQTLIGGLVAAALATQLQANSLLALGSETVSWVDSVGIGEVGPGFIHSARIS